MGYGGSPDGMLDLAPQPYSVPDPLMQVPYQIDNPLVFNAVNGPSLGADYEFDAFPSAPTIPTGWYWSNQQNATYTEQYGMGIINGPSAGATDELVMLVTMLPQPWTTITAKMSMGSSDGSANCHGGLVLQNTSLSKQYTFGPAYATGWRLTYWPNTNTTGSSNITNRASGANQAPIVFYERITQHSTTSFDFEYSADGAAWTAFTLGHNPTGNVASAFNRFGFVCDPNASRVIVTCHWIRVR
jgi:hypothetical protein